MAKLLIEKSNILSNPDLVRQLAMEEEYYTKDNHPEIYGEMICTISKDVSKEFGVLSDATQEVINHFQELTNKKVTNYKTYLQYNTESSDEPYVHTDHYLTLNEGLFPVEYIGNVYITPSDIAQNDSARFEFFTANELDESAEMEDYLKLGDDKLTALSTKAFEYNKAIIFDSSIPHRNAPICATYWGTTQADSPLCFTVFMNTL